MCVSVTSIFSSWPQVFDAVCGGYGASLVELVRALGAVDGAVSCGRALGQGAVSVVITRGRSPPCSGGHGRDKGAGGTGVSLCNLSRGRHGEKRWCRGSLVDALGRLGASCGEVAVKRGKKGCAALLVIDATVVLGDRGHHGSLRGREGKVAGDQGVDRVVATTVVCSAATAATPLPAMCSTQCPNGI